MSIEFKLPALGADMDYGTVVEWRLKPGDEVHRGDIVALVETEKGIIDLESFQDGKLEKLVVEPGLRVPVGTVLALLEGEAPEAQPKPLPTAEKRSTAPSPGRAISPPGRPAAAVATARPRASPAARILATERDIDLARVQGTGPGGVITREDVERAAPAVPVPSAAPARSMREVIGAAMARSKREIPHYYLSTAVDFGACREWLTSYNEKVEVAGRLLTVVPILRAVALALAKVEGFNGYFREGGFVRSDDVHLGVAIAMRGGGLIAPAILDAGTKTMPELMQALRDLVTRARTSRLRNRELSESTITVTSLGEEGVDAIQPIIYPPQVAILGVGTVMERPWVAAGELAVRPVVNLTLAADHRVSDGRRGAQFLAAIRDLLQTPERL